MSALQIKLGSKPTGNEMNDVKEILVIRPAAHNNHLPCAGIWVNRNHGAIGNGAKFPHLRSDQVRKLSRGFRRFVHIAPSANQRLIGRLFLRAMTVMPWRVPVSEIASNKFYSRGYAMQAEPKIWRGNECISIYYFNVLQIGGVIDHVDVVPKPCPALQRRPDVAHHGRIAAADAKKGRAVDRGGIPAQAYMRPEVTGQRNHPWAPEDSRRGRAMFPVTCFATFAVEFPILRHRTGRALCGCCPPPKASSAPSRTGLSSKWKNGKLPSKNA
jgi:hypothetical protein